MGYLRNIVRRVNKVGQGNTGNTVKSSTVSKPRLVYRVAQAFCPPLGCLTNETKLDDQPEISRSATCPEFPINPGSTLQQISDHIASEERSNSSVCSPQSCSFSPRSTSSQLHPFEACDSSDWENEPSLTIVGSDDDDVSSCDVIPSREVASAVHALVAGIFDVSISSEETGVCSDQNVAFCRTFSRTNLGRSRISRQSKLAWLLLNQRSTTTLSLPNSNVIDDVSLASHSDARCDVIFENNPDDALFHWSVSNASSNSGSACESLGVLSASLLDTRDDSKRCENANERRSVTSLVSSIASASYSSSSTEEDFSISQISFDPFSWSEEGSDSGSLDVKGPCVVADFVNDPARTWKLSMEMQHGPSWRLETSLRYPSGKNSPETNVDKAQVRSTSCTNGRSLKFGARDDFGRVTEAMTSEGQAVTSRNAGYRVFTSWEICEQLSDSSSGVWSSFLDD